MASAALAGTRNKKRQSKKPPINPPAIGPTPDAKATVMK